MLRQTVDVSSPSCQLISSNIDNTHSTSDKNLLISDSDLTLPIVVHYGVRNSTQHPLSKFVSYLSLFP